MTKTAVVALGGNAITRPGQEGTYAEQTDNVRAMADAVCRLRADGWSVVLVHGNGPQVGNLAIQQEEGAHRVPVMPLFLLGAMTEGHIGCLLGLALREAGGPAAPSVGGMWVRTRAAATAGLWPPRTHWRSSRSMRFAP